VRFGCAYPATEHTANGRCSCVAVEAHDDRGHHAVGLREVFRRNGRPMLGALELASASIGRYANLLGCVTA